MIHFLILHLTILLIVAFFVLFAAQKADGLIRIFGQVLGIWLILAAALHLVFFFVPGMRGAETGYMHEKMMGQGWMHQHWMHHWGMGNYDGNAGQSAPPPQPAPAPKHP